ncbi:hypothetical protein [Shimazuella kribbensis]|nr:hypothetical protein [Shimazuella kribbensis]
MTEQKNNTPTKNEKTGFWASLSISDYLELLLYIGLGVAVVYEAINYFS